jgi:AcrR family transcriptional regulator
MLTNDTPTLHHQATCLEPSLASLDAFIDRRIRPSTSGGDRERLTAHDRREQLLSAATVAFARTGFHATTTSALAKAAGVSEPTLYVHFVDKEDLFRQVVTRESVSRIHALKIRLSSIGPATPRKWMEQLIEATVSVNLSADGGPVLTSWALLELPDFGVDLHREEIGTVAAIWQQHLPGRLPDGACAPVVSAHTMGCIEACYAYALWLGALRHTEASAAPLVRQFAAGAAEAAYGLIRAATLRRKWSIKGGS